MNTKGKRILRKVSAYFMLAFGVLSLSIVCWFVVARTASLDALLVMLFIVGLWFVWGSDRELKEARKLGDANGEKDECKDE